MAGRPMYKVASYQNLDVTLPEGVMYAVAPYKVMEDVSDVGSAQVRCLLMMFMILTAYFGQVSIVVCK